MLFHFVVLGGCAVKRAFPTVWAGEARRGGKGRQTGSERGRVHQFSVHPPKANLDPTPEPSPALITRTGSTYSSAAVNKNNSSIYVRLTCCLMATMCFAGIARIPAAVRNIPPVGKPPKPHSCWKLSSLYYLLVCLGAAQFELSLWGCSSGESIRLSSQLLDSGTITACSDIYTVLHRLCFVLAMKAWTFALEKHYRTSCLNMLRKSASS